MERLMEAIRKAKCVGCLTGAFASAVLSENFDEKGE